ncbi:MAG: hypothetical protein AB7G93_23615 [Bdellovibrionales bacterium]
MKIPELPVEEFTTQNLIRNQFCLLEHGMWYARSAEFMQNPTFDLIRWLRVIGDTIFALGAFALGLFVVGLKAGHSVKETVDLSDEICPKS